MSTKDSKSGYFYFNQFGEDFDNHIKEWERNNPTATITDAYSEATKGDEANKGRYKYIFQYTEISKI